MKDGAPLSWKHFVYGMSCLSRSWARESLRMGSAARVAGAEEKEFGKWRGLLELAAGWR
jgi:hypothetical protein